MLHVFFIQDATLRNAWCNDAASTWVNFWTLDIDSSPLTCLFGLECHLFQFHLPWAFPQGRQLCPASLKLGTSSRNNNMSNPDDPFTGFCSMPPFPMPGTMPMPGMPMPPMPPMQPPTMPPATTGTLAPPVMPPSLPAPPTLPAPPAASADAATPVSAANAGGNDAAQNLSAEARLPIAGEPFLIYDDNEISVVSVGARVSGLASLH